MMGGVGWRGGGGGEKGAGGEGERREGEEGRGGEGWEGEGVAGRVGEEGIHPPERPSSTCTLPFMHPRRTKKDGKPPSSTLPSQLPLLLLLLLVLLVLMLVAVAEMVVVLVLVEEGAGRELLPLGAAAAVMGDGCKHSSSDSTPPTPDRCWLQMEEGGVLEEEQLRSCTEPSAE